MQMQDTRMPPALDGLRVVDFSQGVAGPHAGLLLAQHGADVIKVEPAGGDWGRILGERHGDFSAYSLNFNRGKRSIALDLKSAEGRAVATRLAGAADVVIEAFRPGVMARFGLGADTLMADHPGLVYLSITGFGQRGPRAHLPVTDGVIQGFSGLMQLNRTPDGTPRRFPMVLIDVTTGLYGAQAVMAALLRRARTGRGEHIDCSLMHSALALQAPAILEHQFENGKPETLYVPLGVVGTRDGHLSIAVRTDAHFRALCSAIGRDDLGADPRYADRKSRIRHEHELMSELAATFATRESAEWVERLVPADVTHSIVRSYQDVLDDPDSEASGYLEAVTLATRTEPVRMPTLPGLAPTTAGAARGCPQIGEHTGVLLREAGYADDDVARLLRDGVIFGNAA